VNVAALVTGQILFKIGVRGRAFDSIPEVARTMFSPVILGALVIYASATVLWLYILSKMPISRAYPIQALAYPVMLVLSKFLFNETISVARWIGMGIILIGVFIVAR